MRRVGAGHARAWNLDLRAHAAGGIPACSLCAGSSLARPGAVARACALGNPAPIKGWHGRLAQKRSGRSQTPCAAAGCSDQAGLDIVDLMSIVTKKRHGPVMPKV